MPPPCTKEYTNLCGMVSGNIFNSLPSYYYISPVSIKQRATTVPLKDSIPCATWWMLQDLKPGVQSIPCYSALSKRHPLLGLLMEFYILCFTKYYTSLGWNMAPNCSSGRGYGMTVEFVQYQRLEATKMSVNIYNSCLG